MCTARHASRVKPCHLSRDAKTVVLSMDIGGIFLGFSFSLFHAERAHLTYTCHLTLRFRALRLKLYGRAHFRPFTA